MRHLILVPLAVATLAAGCAPRDRGAGGASAVGMRDLLTADEIAARADLPTALDAVRRLRPEFLRHRGATSMRTAAPDPVIVYLNGVNAGGIGILEQIRAIDVIEIRYVNGRDATTRYGTGHGGGVLEVRTGT
jgi:hypothetical protein